ncbi:MAG: glycosyltransferase [archaeon]
MRNNKMLISVIIPSLNEERYIGRILKQIADYRCNNPTKIESIVSDDFSTDKTVSIARKYGARVILKKGKKTSVADSRNRGAWAARGKILVFMDADTFLENPKNFFDEIVSILDDENIVAAVPYMDIHPSESTFTDKIWHRFGNFTILLSNKMGIGRGGGQCQIIKAKYFKKLKGYNKYLNVLEDIDLIYRLSRIGKVKFFGNLKAYESPRRYHKYGYFRVVILGWGVMGIINKINYLIRRKNKGWGEVR